jgi:hypothetical protein
VTKSAAVFLLNPQMALIFANKTGFNLRSSVKSADKILIPT